MTTKTSQWRRSRDTWHPRPEQLRGLKLILRGLGARLFLHPGKGKTSVVLHAFKALKDAGHVDKLLVIAPLRVVTTSWPSQIEKWEDLEGLTYKLIHGDRAKAMSHDADIYLMNFEGLLSKEWRTTKGRGIVPPASLIKWLTDNRFMVAYDESTKMKNPNSQRFKLVKKIVKYLHFPVVMTGTPKPNKLEDLFAQCYLTDGGKDLGSFITHFRHEYMMPSYSGFGFDPQHGADVRVAEKIAPTTLQLAYEEAVPSQIIPIWVKMPEEVKRQYDELKEEFLTVLGDDVLLAPTAATALGKLRQFAQGAVYLDDEVVELHGAKLDALETLIEELDGEPLFCLTSFRHDVLRIADRLGKEIPYIGSGTSAKRGAEFCQAFGAGALPLLAAHPASAAHGIDGLQNNCKNVVWFGLTWSWEEFYQANLRIVRDGSKADEVFIYQILVDCGVERAILASVSGKQKSEEAFCTHLRNHL